MAKENEIKKRNININININILKVDKKNLPDK
jgi:hypothetical protein